MSRIVNNFGDWVSVEDRDGGTSSFTTFVVCDDCREAYQEPPYYTFDTDACKESVGQDIFVTPHENCTGNLCPDCAQFLTPDDEDDPRNQQFELVEINGVRTATSKGARA